MLSTRSFQSGFRVLHNGKGRPKWDLSQTRSYSRLPTGVTFRPSINRASIAERAIRHYPRPSAVLQFHRHASTSPTPSLPPETTGKEWDALLQEASASHVTNIEPHIGWLKELGLDYGWGPTSLMQMVLENFSQLSGLPWWASMMAVAMATRALVFPLHVRASDTGARMARLKPVLGPLQEKMKIASANNDMAAQAAATQELRLAYKAADVRIRNMIIPVILQGVLGFGLFRLVNGMCRLPVPGLSEGGLLWFTDLTVSDPTFILPVASSLIMYYIVKSGGESGTAQMSPGMLRFMLYGLPGLSGLIFINFPAGLQWLAFVASAWSIVQVSLLRSPAFRRWANIASLPQKQNLFKKSEGPYKGTVNTYRTPDEIAKSHTIAARWASMRKPVTDYVEKQRKDKKTTRLSARDLDKAQQYEKERRAEIDAARERFLNKKQK